MHTKGELNARYKVCSVFFFMGAKAPMKWTIIFLFYFIFLLDHLIPTFVLHVEFQMKGDLRPGIGAQTRPFELIVPRNNVKVPLQVLWLRILYVYRIP